MSIGTASTSAAPSVVRLEDVGKRYLKYEDLPLLITRALPFKRSGKRSMLWAIRHVDLDVVPGETVGIIGRNGSGKTTLLRMLAGVTAPTEGTVTVRGRVAPLIALGVGFHPELTGRENVFVNGIILGLSRREIERKFDEIVAFAELEKFIDTPVKFYSSGMFVRLGFSVAVAAIPDVMLVDEVLGVGDLAFQFKSFERMKELCSQGAATLVVSHNLIAVRNLCSRVLVVHDGSPRFLGPADEAISIYYDLLQVGGEQGDASVDGGAPIEILDLQLVDADGRRTAHLRAGDEALFRVSVRVRRSVKKTAFGFVLKTADDITAYVDTDYASTGGSFQTGETVECEIRFPVALATGSYSAIVGIHWEDEETGRLESAPLSFYVSGRMLVTGIADLGASFNIRSRTVSNPEVEERA